MKHRYIFTKQLPGKTRTYTHTEAVIETMQAYDRQRAQRLAESHYQMPAGHLDDCAMEHVEFNDKAFEG